MEIKELRLWLLTLLETPYPAGMQFRHIVGGSQAAELGVTEAALEATLDELIQDEKVFMVGRPDLPSRTYVLTALGPVAHDGQVIDVPSASSPKTDTEQPTVEDEPSGKQSAVPVTVANRWSVVINDTHMEQWDRGKREEAVQPLIGEPYNLERLETRINESAAAMAHNALTIGATLIAIKTVEAEDHFKQWWQSKPRPFDLRMAYRFTANARKVLADPRLMPALQLAPTKAEILLSSVNDDDAQELADHGTIQGRTLDTYDSMGRRELEQQLRGLQSERDKATSELQKLKDEMKVRKVAWEDELKEKERLTSGLKQEIAMMKILHPPNERQQHAIEVLRKQIIQLEGLMYLSDAENAGHIFAEAPIELLAEAAAFYQRHYIMAKLQLLTFEKLSGYSSEAGMDAAIDELEGFRIGIIDKGAPWEQIEAEARAAGEAEKAKKNTPPGTLAFKKR